MPNRVTAVLLAFYAIAVASFALALVSLERDDDVTAIVLCLLAGLSLRALRQASRIAEGSSR